MTGGHLLLLDLLSAQSELFPRLDKGLVKDHKIGENLAQPFLNHSKWQFSGVERVQMVKSRGIKGALATDHALREVVEKRVSDHWTLGTRTLSCVNVYYIRRH